MGTIGGSFRTPHSHNNQQYTKAKSYHPAHLSPGKMHHRADFITFHHISSHFHHFFITWLALVGRAINYLFDFWDPEPEMPLVLVRNQQGRGALIDLGHVTVFCVSVGLDCTFQFNQQSCPMGPMDGYWPLQPGGQPGEQRQKRPREPRKVICPPLAPGLGSHPARMAASLAGPTLIQSVIMGVDLAHDTHAAGQPGAPPTALAW